MEGILLVNKPKGWTSFDVVNYVRSMVARHLGKKPRQIKVGHTGTLDPSATGLLVLCVGKNYTKKVPDMIVHDKTYRAQVTFGAFSTTGDSEGRIIYDKKRKILRKTQVEKILKKLTGEIEQIPPDFSAVKVNGKRAYELARAGKKVELKPRQVFVYSIDLLDFKYPNADIMCKVSSGTYIRVLAEDVGKQLGVGAYLSELHRTEVDSWLVQDAVDIKDISIDIIKKKLFV